jgi:hypothetical protein
LADNQTKDPISEYSLSWITAIFFLVMLLSKLDLWFSVWIRSYRHQLLLALGIVGALAWLFYWIAWKRDRMKVKREKDAAILGPAEGAVYCGITDNKKAVFAKERQRAMHTQVIGTTNAGKTESVILPWAIRNSGPTP